MAAQKEPFYLSKESVEGMLKEGFMRRADRLVRWQPFRTLDTALDWLVEVGKSAVSSPATYVGSLYMDVDAQKNPTLYDIDWGRMYSEGVDDADFTAADMKNWLCDEDKVMDGGMAGWEDFKPDRKFHLDETFWG